VASHPEIFNLFITLAPGSSLLFTYFMTSGNAVSGDQFSTWDISHPAFSVFSRSAQRKKFPSSFFISNIFSTQIHQVKLKKRNITTGRSKVTVFNYLFSWRDGSLGIQPTNFLSMRRVFISYFQPMRFFRIDGKSKNCRLPALDLPRNHDSWC